MGWDSEDPSRCPTPTNGHKRALSLNKISHAPFIQW